MTPTVAAGTDDDDGTGGWRTTPIAPAAGRLPGDDAALLQDTEPREKVLREAMGRVRN